MPDRSASGPAAICRNMELKWGCEALVLISIPGRSECEPHPQVLPSYLYAKMQLFSHTKPGKNLSGELSEFSISRWAAWTPGVHDLQGWREWIKGKRMSGFDKQPDVSFLPPLLRRRLDHVGRMALHVIWRCAEDHENLLLVYASRHGTLSRTVELLNDLARDEPLSPSTFSLSVHNSVAGLFSIFRSDTSPAIALAAGAMTLPAALLEGIGILGESGRPVLVVYADDLPPHEYQRYMTPEEPGTPEEPSFALSLLLSPPASTAPWYRLVSKHCVPRRERPEVTLMRFLVENASTYCLGLSEPGWQVERVEIGHDK